MLVKVEGKGVQQMWDLLVETLKECEARFIPDKIVEINQTCQTFRLFCLVLQGMLFSVSQSHDPRSARAD